MNTLNEESLSFMMNTLLEMINLKINKLKLKKEEILFNKMTREDKCDTTIQLINELF
jgi:hypothetical protein